MYADLLQSFIRPAYSIIFVILLIAIPIFVLRKFLKIWVKYVRTQFFSKQEYTVLNLKIPRNNLKSPIAMEIVINALYQSNKDYTFENKYWTGEVSPWFSLEICSFEGAVEFFIWTKTKYKDLIENQLYSQFADIEIHDIGEKDYTYEIPFDLNKYEYWGCEFKKKEASHIPIKTYTTYKLDKDPDEEVKIDPITPTIEFLGSLKKGEQVWIQICISAHSKEDAHPEKRGERIDWRYHANKDLIIKTKRNMSMDEKKMNPALYVMTKGEKDVVDAIEDAITKTPFDCGIRAVYIAEKNVFRKSVLGGIANSFKQYNANNLNSFETMNAVDKKVKHAWLDFGNKKLNKYKEKFISLYRHRSFFYPEYIPHGYDDDSFVMNVEELATLYHFPGDVSKTPTMTRVTAKKAEPPSNLPV